MDHFGLHAPFEPTGDQPQAIVALNKPTLAIAHNKTHAAQFYGEFKEMFPENGVDYMECMDGIKLPGRNEFSDFHS